MARPQAYSPEPDQKYQILYKGPGERAFEHLDYAVDRAEKKELLEGYQMAHKGIGEMKTILLPAKYWPKKQPTPAVTN